MRASKHRTIAIFLIIITVYATASSGTAIWKFAILSDSSVASWDSNAANILEVLAEDMKKQGIDLAIFPGDMISGSDSFYQADAKYRLWKLAMMPLYASGTPVYTIRGNHDLIAPDELFSNNTKLDKDPYIKNFPLLRNAISPDGGYTYAFVHKNAKFIGFDQFINRNNSFDDNLYASGSNQGQMMNGWVISQINGSPSPLNFAFAHEPLFPSKSHHDCMANDPDSRDDLISALGAHGGAYFCGHDHFYLHATAFDGRGQSIPELIVGTAGTGNYNFTPVETPDYLGRGGYSINRVYCNSDNPYFGYLLIIVDENDNTYKGEFRGFTYIDYLNKGPLDSKLIQTLDRFAITSKESYKSSNGISSLLQPFIRLLQ
jgi:hypothetical protein